MASSSTSSPTRVKEYDVFLSFRGADTRNNIVSYLHKALVDVGIRTFKDDKELEEGDIISEKLVNAIQTSWFAVVVLSEKYVTSSWCLEELRHIMELSIQDDIIVVPIFYKVEPSDVRYQKNSFEVKLQHYRDPEKILKWKGALTQVGNMSGKHFQTCSDEATNIAEIVSKISNRLRKMKPTDLINLVGMDAHMEKMQLLLDKEPKSEVRMIGILGMGGIGKTAIANYLYNQFSHEYWAHCFIEDAWNTNDPTHLQRKLLSHICNDENAKLFTREAGAMKIKGILKHKKFFLVIDGVNKAEQVHALAKERSWFGPGSLIIITTRDRGLLNSCGVNNVYEVKCLDSKDALQVFEKFAFGGRNPPFHGSERLFTRASQLAHGLPYALVAFASHLSEQTTIEGWEDELFRLEDYPQKNVEEILRASYDDLDYYEQSVFLQVACLFNGSFLWLIRAFLGKLGSRINSLRAKSLLDISNDGRLIMHFLVEQIGKEIVRQQSNCIPSEQKFLWKPEEIYDVLARNIGTSKIHGVSLEMCDLSDTLRIGSSAGQCVISHFSSF
ncbi:disease resistance protein (TIR-NBS-LRR class) [Arabidopsis thaliana]|uniref:Disease resistance protein (TIR-NBS-LRR class) n=1 Tax=Arabidopsis thaliana TaxID=3702 RepID=F4JK03_ARATH|nr:disease resistance protein (TIR-NBS-LRR class) [Arabidopsis thaliana]AEE82747.2 disease resistance protein (TIR-NBS-LRR class) [Arabidopsis thaliana]|eukprot:NP_001319887.1 disease resistance protein (TIR-NBS-LRR class) [Arabidopsis thaliana]